MSAFHELVYDWVSHGQLAKVKDLFERTCTLRDLSKRSHLVNTIRSDNGVKTTLLLTACGNNYLETTAFLVEKCGANVDLSGDIKINDSIVEGVTPLWLACRKNNTDMARLLVGAGANVNCLTKKTLSSPLRAACHGGFLEMVQLLVEHGADIELGNFRKYTGLMVACSRGHFEVVQYLLEMKANINAVAADGHTCLHSAAERGDIEMLKLLLSAGAEPKPDKVGVTPVLAAAMNENEEALKILARNLPKHKIADALELLGAKKICNVKQDLRASDSLAVGNQRMSKGPPNSLKIAMELWQQAASIRQQTATSKYGKHILEPRGVYDNILEFRNTKDLATIQGDNEKIYYTALIICERILGLNHPFTYNSIRDVAVIFGKLHEYAICFRLCLHAVDIHLLNLNPFCSETFHLFRCCINLFYAFKVEDHHMKECLNVIRSFYRRLMTLLKRIEYESRLNSQIDDKRSMVNGYFSLAAHTLTLLSEANDSNVGKFIDQIATLKLSNGVEVFNSLASSIKLEGTDVVDWNAVGSISKLHLLDIAKKAAEASKIARENPPTTVLRECDNFESSSDKLDKLSAAVPAFSSVNYEILETLHYGDFDVSMLAQRVDDRTQVVLQEISLEGMTVKERQDAIKEFSDLLNLKHHHCYLIRFFHIFLRGNAKLVLESSYCSGETLSMIIAKRKRENSHFPEKLIRKWVFEIASAVNYCHNNGIIHKNIQTSNIIISSGYDTLKLGAIRSSAQLEQQRLMLDEEGLSMAPEVVSGAMPYTKKADVWALGALCYEAVTLRKLTSLSDVSKMARPQGRFSILPICSKDAVNFAKKLLKMNVDERPSFSEIVVDKFLD